MRDCKFTIEAGDTVFAPRMEAVLLRTMALARRYRDPAETRRGAYRRPLERALNAVMALAPTNRDGRQLRKRYGSGILFTFLTHPK